MKIGLENYLVYYVSNFQASEIKESNSKALAEVNSKVKALEQERNDLKKRVSNTIEALEKNLKEISQALSDAKSKIEKLKQEKSELQVEANINKTMFAEMKESNAQALAEVNAKVKNLEQEQDDLKKKDFTENNQALTDAKCEIGKLKKEKRELQIEADGNKNKIEEMEVSNAKDQTFKDKLAIKVFSASLCKATHEKLESLLKLDLEELYSKSNEDKGGLISKGISNLVLTYKFFQQNHFRLKTYR